MTLGIILIARACGNFNASPGSPVNYVIVALSALFVALFAVEPVEPVVWLLKKLVGIGRKEGQDI